MIYKCAVYPSGEDDYKAGGKYMVQPAIERVE